MYILIVLFHRCYIHHIRGASVTVTSDQLLCVFKRRFALLSYEALHVCIINRFSGACHMNHICDKSWSFVSNIIACFAAQLHRLAVEAALNCDTISYTSTLFCLQHVAVVLDSAYL